jgi:hypothetical protein
MKSEIRISPDFIKLAETNQISDFEILLVFTAGIYAATRNGSKILLNLYII